jgi:hypothetical protein
MILVDGRSIGKFFTHPTLESIGLRNRRLPYDSRKPHFDQFTELQASLQQPGTSNGRLRVRRLQYDSLNIRNSILHTRFYYDLFPTTYTLLLIAITFHLLDSTLTNTSAKMNSETMTKKRLVDILTHKNWREWF